jgi:hypothetical protein
MNHLNSAGRMIRIRAYRCIRTGACLTARDNIAQARGIERIAAAGARRGADAASM